MNDRRRRQNGNVVVWVGQLSLAVAPALFRTFLRRGRLELRFVTATGGGALLLRCLGLIGVVSCARSVRFTGEGARVDDARSGSLSIQIAMSDFARDVVSAHAPLLGALAARETGPMAHGLAVNIRKTILQRVYELFVFVESARYARGREGRDGERDVVLSPQAGLGRLLPGVWRDLDVDIVALPGSQHALTAWLFRGLRKDVATALRRRRQPGGEARIAIGIAWGVDQKSRVNDLYWWWDSGIPAERLILLFDRPDVPATADIVAAASKLGVRCVVTDARAAGDTDQPVWRPRPGLWRALSRMNRKLAIAAWGAGHGVAGRWLACRALQTRYWAETIEDFMREFGVRAVFHQQDTDVDFISVACEAIGAARIGHQWSNLSWAMEDQVRLHQVYFAWGTGPARLLQEIGSSIGHLLVSGCILRGAHPNAEPAEPARAARNAIVAAGATRLVTLFDTSVPSDSFYEFFLTRVLDDERWGLMIKPKNQPSQMPWMVDATHPLHALYGKAVETRRVAMLPHTLSPAEAAAESDFCVGVGTNSATIVAALAGHRSIHLDYLRTRATRFGDRLGLWRAGANRLLFEEPEPLWTKLNRYFDRPGSEPNLGVHDDALLRLIDPFRDGQSGERIGGYVRRYLEALDAGMDRDAALRCADEGYARQWGADKVIGRPEQDCSGSGHE